MIINIYYVGYKVCRCEFLKSKNSSDAKNHFNIRSMFNIRHIKTFTQVVFVQRSFTLLNTIAFLCWENELPVLFKTIWTIVTPTSKTLELPPGLSVHQSSYIYIHFSTASYTMSWLVLGVNIKVLAVEFNLSNIDEAQNSNNTSFSQTWQTLHRLHP